MRCELLGLSFVDLLSFYILLFEKEGLKRRSSTRTDFSRSRWTIFSSEKILVRKQNSLIARASLLCTQRTNQVCIHLVHKKFIAFCSSGLISCHPDHLCVYQCYSCKHVHPPIVNISVTMFWQYILISKFTGSTNNGTLQRSMHEKLLVMRLSMLYPTTPCMGYSGARWGFD